MESSKGTSEKDGFSEAPKIFSLHQRALWEFHQ